MANRTLDVRGGPEKQTSRNATDMFGSRVSQLIHLSFQLRISVADTTSWEQVAREVTDGLRNEIAYLIAVAVRKLSAYW